MAMKLMTMLLLTILVVIVVEHGNGLVAQFDPSGSFVVVLLLLLITTGPYSCPCNLQR
jgi:hypothetical protein